MDQRRPGLYEPARRGPLSGLTPDQVENLLLRAVLADLKAGVSASLRLAASAS